MPPIEWTGMRQMSPSEIEEALGGPHQAILSVSRTGRGPLAVPMSFLFSLGEFRMITSRDTDHGRLIAKTGRASMTVHHDDVTSRSVEQWYVTAEGPIEFTDENPESLLREILTKDRGSEFADEWTSQSLVSVGEVAVLRPARLAGYHGTSILEQK